MLKPVGFGTGCNVHFLTLGFFTPTHKVIAQPSYPQHTTNTNRKKDAYMATESLRDNRTWLILSLAWYSPQLEVYMGKEAKIVFKRIASLVSVKKDTPYSKVINWIRCRLSFSLLRSSLLCIRGTRSHTHNALKNSDISIELALSESHLN